MLDVSPQTDEIATGAIFVDSEPEVRLRRAAGHDADVFLLVTLSILDDDTTIGIASSLYGMSNDCGDFETCAISNLRRRIENMGGGTTCERVEKIQISDDPARLLIKHLLACYQQTFE